MKALVIVGLAGAYTAAAAGHVVGAAVLTLLICAFVVCVIFGLLISSH